MPTCLRCRYDLHSLSPTSACPECGLAVSFSLTPPTTLAAAPPSWARTLAIGSALLFLSIPAIPATSIFVNAHWPLLPNLTPAEFAHRIEILTNSNIATLLFHALAIWILTTREPRTPRLSPRRLGVHLARLCSLGPAFTLIAQGYLAYRVRFFNAHQEFLFYFLFLYLPVPALVFLHLRRLAARIGRPRLAEHAAIVGVGLSACFTTLFLGNLLPLPNKLANTLAILPVACIFLFILWALLLLARLTHAFHRATAEARAAWQSADQSN